MPYMTVQRVLNMFHISWKSLDTNIKRGTVEIPLAKIQHADVFGGFAERRQRSAPARLHCYCIRKSTIWIVKTSPQHKATRFSLLFSRFCPFGYKFVFTVDLSKTLSSAVASTTARWWRPDRSCADVWVPGQTWHTALESLFVLRALVFCHGFCLVARQSES